MKIIPIPVRETNLMYIVLGENRELIFIDPYDPKKIKEEAEKAGADFSKMLCLTTHCHQDHSSGNKGLQEIFPEIDIYAGSERSFNTKTVKNGEVIDLGTLKIQCMHVPCHTSDSFAYFIEDSLDEQNKAVFVGDTIFYLGCGKFFEGSAEHMQKATSLIMNLPEKTRLHYGHNYKEVNLHFRNHILKDQKPKIEHDSLFLTVKEEKENNLFINTELLASLERFKNLSSIERIQTLREMKNEFDDIPIKK